MNDLHLALHVHIHLHHRFNFDDPQTTIRENASTYSQTIERCRRSTGLPPIKVIDLSLILQSRPELKRTPTRVTEKRNRSSLITSEGIISDGIKLDVTLVSLR